MRILEFLKFDPWTAVITLVVAPVVYVVLRTIGRHLKVLGKFATEGLLAAVSHIFMRSLSARISLRKYCRTLLSSTRYVHVPSRADVAIELDQIYVTLSLDRLDGREHAFNHTDLLSAGNRIRVVGDPGSGKSSLVRRLLRDAAKQAIEAPTKSRFPLLYELRNIDIPDDIIPTTLGKWLLDRVRAQAAEADVYGIAECFDAYAGTSGLLLLLDGLDEISTEQYDRAQAAIMQLADLLSTKSERNAMVLTTRVQFHQQIKRAFTTTFPTALFLKPFTPTDIYDFLTRWPFASDAKAKIRRIYGELTDRPTLRELCGNPLVLSMYVAEAEEQADHVIPESRTEFYASIAEELLMARRARQTGPPVARQALRQAREHLFGRLALDHLLDPRQPRNSLSWRSGIDALSEIMNVTGEEAEQKFEELSKETGLFAIERPRESFRFIHLTFCEFFAAVEAVRYRAHGWSDLIKTHDAMRKDARPEYHARLIEVIPFAAGLLMPVDRSAALDDIAAVDDSSLLARALLETKLYSHPSFDQFVRRQKDDLLARSNERWTEEWLRDLHLFNVVVADARRAKSEAGLASPLVDLDAFLRELVSRNQAALARLLSAYAERDAASVFRVAEVGHLDLVADFPEVIFKNCDQRPFFEMVKEQAMHDTRRVHAWASIFAEAALRSRVVATEMHAIAPWPVWRQAAENVAASHRWWHPRLLKRSVLTESLSVAAANPTLGTSFVLTRELQHVPAPSTYGWLMSSAWLLLVPVLAAIPIVAYFHLPMSRVAPFVIAVILMIIVVNALRTARNSLERLYASVCGVGVLDADQALSYVPRRLTRATNIFFRVKDVHASPAEQGRVRSGAHHIIHES